MVAQQSLTLLEVVQLHYPLPKIQRNEGGSMLVEEAAKKLNISTQTLRLGLQQNKFPFGTAVKTSPRRYTYYINETALEKYLKGS